MILNDEFIEEIDAYLKSNYSKVIQLETVKSAYNIFEYYSKNKLVLAGFKSDGFVNKKFVEI